MKKILDSDWLRGVQFYFKLHCMQCKLTKQEQRLETSRKFNMASVISSVNLVPRARDLQEKNRELWDDP